MELLVVDVLRIHGRCGGILIPIGRSIDLLFQRCLRKHKRFAVMLLRRDDLLSTDGNDITTTTVC